ncbi:MAG TPA: hypothetical protein VGF74_12810 [Thermoleophilaceae bacterium]
MRRSVALPIGVVVAVLLVVLVLSQLLLPPIAASKIEHRLTKDGGDAQVSLHAFPALRLLFQHGDSIDVTGSGLTVQLGSGGQKVLQKLDHFGAAHIHLTDVRSGPLVTQSFNLDKQSGQHVYEVSVRASFTPSALASYLGSSVGGGLGGLFGGIAGGLVAGNQPVPVAVEVQMVSNDGAPRVVSGAGTVAGVPMGPVLEAVVAAIVARL